MRRSSPLLASIALTALLAVPGSAGAAPPRHIWGNTGDGADVLAATFLGGKGHEWLAAGGFQPDGTVVLVGNVLGPTLEMPVEVKVIGTDLPAPAAVEPVVVMEKGKPKLGKDGKPVVELPSWQHAGGTAFVARCSPDLKKVISVHRFPWTAGVATAAAIGPDGEIYVAGRATDGVAKLGGEAKELEAPKESSKAASCNHAFVVRLTADASKAVWVRNVRGPSAAPTLNFANGKVRFGAGALSVLEADGKLAATISVPGGLKFTKSVNPVDGTIAIGGEHNSPTGREPWRCPSLDIHKPDGTLRHQLYNWGGPYVGLDSCRQVSDSTVKFVTHDADGSILLYAWSDGGNSVMVSEPFDVKTGVKPRGLGLNAAGAHVLSCAYLIRLDPKDYHVTAWTFWAANNGEPNSIWVDQMTRTPDGAVCVAGLGVSDIWQTKNRLTEAAAFGYYISVFSDDFSALRFSSVIPGAGAAEITDGARRGTWGIGTGTVNGKSRVLFLCGATAGRVDNGTTDPTPTRNAAQEAFGGGWCDGYAVLLELPTPKPKLAVPVAAPKVGPTESSFEVRVGGPPPKTVPKPPEEGTVFEFRANSPKYVSVDVEMRDQAGKRWPSFLCGKPVEGTLTYKAAGPEAKFTVACPMLCQSGSDPSVRAIGSFLDDAQTKPALTFTLDSLGPPKSTDVKYTLKGQEKTRSIEYFEGKGTLEIGGKKMAVTPRVRVKYTTATAEVTAYLTLEGKDGPVDVRINMKGTVRREAPPK